MWKQTLRIWPLVSALGLALVLSVPALLGASVALAKSQTAEAPRSGPTGKSIDWQHPVRVTVLPAGVHSGRSTDLPPNTVPLSVRSQAGRVEPEANWPTTCWNGYAYQMGDNGVYTWTKTEGHLEAWVQYWWCPLYQGDRNGINWAYGRDYVNSGCDTVLIGSHSSKWGGAWMYNVDYYYDDGETPGPSYSICSNTYLYAWDTSLTGPGNYPWSMCMNFLDPSGTDFNTCSPSF